MDEAKEEFSSTKKAKLEKALSSGKQTLIVHYFGEIPSFDEIGTGILRNANGSLNFVETVRRMTK
jgi:hypothetical protein